MFRISIIVFDVEIRNIFFRNVFAKMIVFNLVRDIFDNFFIVGILMSFIRLFSIVFFYVSVWFCIKVRFFKSFYVLEEFVSGEWISLIDGGILYIKKIFKIIFFCIENWLK